MPFINTLQCIDTDPLIINGSGLPVCNGTVNYYPSVIALEVYSPSNLDAERTQGITDGAYWAVGFFVAGAIIGSLHNVLRRGYHV